MRPLYLLVICGLLAGCASQKDATSSKANITQGISYSEERRAIAIFHDASKAKVLGNFAEAMSKYGQVVSIDPQNSAAWFELATLRAQNGDNLGAIEASKKAHEIEPTNDWYSLQLARLYQRNNLPKNAVKIYQGLVNEHPNNPDHQINLAQAAMQAGDYDLVLKTLNGVEKKYGISEQLSKQKSEVYLSMGKQDEAIAEIEKLSAEFPQEVRYYALLSEMYQKTDQPEKALKTLEKAKAINPDDVNLLISLSEYYRKQGNEEKARENMLAAFGNKNLPIDTKIQILLSYYQPSAKDTNLAKFVYQLLDTTEALHGKNPKATAVYGDFLYRDDRLKEARDKYRLSVGLEGSKYLIWNNLLLIESELQDFDAMAKESQEAMDLFPNQPVVYLFNGIANMQLKKYPKAVKALKAGEEITIDNPQLKNQFLTNLGDAQYQAGNHSEAWSTYDRVLEMSPNNPLVMNNYAYYLSLEKVNLPYAEEMSKKTVDLEPNSSTYLDTYGWILYQSGKYPEAEKYLKQAIDNGGAQSGVVVEHYGDVLFKLGKLDKAMEYWKQAKTKDDYSDQLDTKIETGAIPADL